MVSLKERLNRLLIESGILDEKQFHTVLEIQRQRGGRLSDIIIEIAQIKKEQLNLILSQGLSLPLIDLKKYKIDPEISKIIPQNLAMYYRIIPISKIADTLTVAMADPLDIFAIDHIQALTGYKINPVISEEKDILDVIKEVYPDTSTDIIDNILKEISDTSFEFVQEKREKIIFVKFES
jgi:type IV pilus assembly protein PilB